MLPAWERYRPLLRVYIRRMQLDRRVRHGCDTSDLIQETYVRALKGLDGCQARTEGEFIAWLGKIAKHVVIDQGRAARAVKRDPARLVSVQTGLTQSSVDLNKLIAANCPSPSAHLRTDELRLRLAEAIDQLPEDQRDVVHRFLTEVA
jgi:RNA polymerase sigma factor (sigma-70 family)